MRVGREKLGLRTERRCEAAENDFVSKPWFFEATVGCGRRALMGSSRRALMGLRLIGSQKDL